MKPLGWVIVLIAFGLAGYCWLAQNYPVLLIAIYVAAGLVIALATKRAKPDPAQAPSQPPKRPDPVRWGLTIYPLRHSWKWEPIGGKRNPMALYLPVNGQPVQPDHPFYVPASGEPDQAISLDQPFYQQCLATIYDGFLPPDDQHDKFYLNEQAGLALAMLSIELNRGDEQ